MPLKRIAQRQASRNGGTITTMFGYHGQYLRIDLSHGTCEMVPLAPEELRRFLGGVGLAVHLLMREGLAGIDALAAGAPLVFSLSPLVGTPLTTSAKFAIAAKSPLTNRLNDSLSSSHFAIAAKRAGCDAILLTGACECPSILIIDGETMRIEPAGDLWGRSPASTEAALQARLGPQFQFAVIGPAGERLVRYATVSHANRHAGRGGLGAVMGSKRLKAIAVTGSRQIELADPAAVVKVARDLSHRSFGPATAKYRELGTVSNLLTFNRLSALPTRNFQVGQFEGAKELSSEGLQRTRRSCAACTIGCEHIFPTSDGEVRLEYETLFALGPLCGISDRETVLRAARSCDDLGLDTISAGATIGFAMECVERGLLREGGLCFGNGEMLLSLLERIARREGLGDLLAEGTRMAAEVIGGEAPTFAPHVKGLELPGYEPRTLQTMALGFAVGSRGADHNRSGAYEVDFSNRANRFQGSKESVELAVETEDRAALLDSLILCKFLRGVFNDLWEESAVVLRPVTGWDVTGDELRLLAKRVVTAKKLYNQREGWTTAEDTLPTRLLSEHLQVNDQAVGLPCERLQAMVQAYYQARGWDAEGRVPAGLIESLGLSDLGQSKPARNHLRGWR